MASTVNESAIPTIFNEIIRKRVTDYVDGELKTIIRQKMDSIISDVLGGLQTDTQLFKDMLHYESKLVVTAIYNGKDIEQKQPQSTKGTDNG